MIYHDYDLEVIESVIKLEWISLASFGIFVGDSKMC